MGNFRWNVWKNCGDNPIFPQGGTWPFDRAGWCPGTFVDEYDFPLDAYAWPGDTITIDYGIEMFTDNGEKDGNFRMAHQLFSYGPLNFKNDVEIIEVISPNAKDRYNRVNSGCNQIVLVIRNNGAIPLKNCFISFSTNNYKSEKYIWNGNLKFGEIDTVYINDSKISEINSKTYFTFLVELPNGELDENIQNNIYKTIVNPIDILDNEISIRFETNDMNRAKETSYFIFDANGKLIFQSDFPLKDDSVYTDIISLESGYYQFLVIDKAEDGIVMHWWLRNEDPEKIGKNGKIQILNTRNEELKKFPFDFGEYLIYNFRIE